MRPFIPAVLALTLAACATPEQRAARAIERFGPYCDKIGFKRDTDPWRTCVVNAQAASDAEDDAIAARASANRPRVCTPVGAQVICN